MPTRNASSFDDYIRREFGEGVVTTGSQLVERPRAIIPTAPSLDMALGGGIPEGTVVLISGKPKAGKTSLCLRIQATAQTLGRKVFYFDVEKRLRKSLLETIEGLDQDRLNLVASTPTKVLTGEDHLRILERTIKDHPGAVIVVDSLAALATECEMAEAAGEAREMGGMPKLMASFFRKMGQIVDTNDVVLIFISQMQTNREARGPKYSEKGGLAVQYAASVWLNVSWVQVWQVDEEKQAPLGQDVHFKIIASALGPPLLPCSLPLRFGHGIDIVLDTVRLAEAFGIIEKSGTWYKAPILEGFKCQGTKALWQRLRERPGELAKIDKAVRDIVLPGVVYARKADGRSDDQLEGEE